MNLVELSIPGAYVLESPVFADDRGLFREWFKLPDFESLGLGFAVRQANLSHSVRGTVRGLHYSLAPEGQAKVVTCVAGSLDEVIVDVRVGSPTFGRVEYLTLRANEGRSVLLPAGAAHGFCTPDEPATMAYLLSSPFRPDVELEIDPYDSQLVVPWRVTDGAVMSPKDAAAPPLAIRQERGELPIFAA